MRILYLLTSLGIGGAEKQVIEVAERMKAKGHMVALLVLKHSAEEWPVELPVMRLNMSKTPLGIFKGLRFAKSFVAAFRPNLLHSHTFPANLFARLLKARLDSEANGLRLINTIHNVYEGGWHRMWIYRVTDPWADWITAVSSAVAERFLQRRAVSAAKTSVLSNGIDTEFFTPDRARRKRVRMQMRVTDEFVWLALGRLAPAKDYPNLLRAFHQLRAARPDASLWIAGEGDAAELQLDPIDAGNNSGVQFLGLRHDTADLLDAADGFVLSSAWEGMPLALGEAMAMEKIVVATDVGGVRELMGETGFIVAAKDSTGLQGAMLQVMLMPRDKRKFMEAAARRRIQQQYSIQRKAEEWEQLYLQIMNEPRQ